MEKFSKEYFKTLANQIMFDLSDSELEDVQTDFKTLIKQLELLDKINTDGVQEMIYPFELETVYLREDKVSNTISKADVLVNAPNVLNDQIIVPKVVK